MDLDQQIDNKSVDKTEILDQIKRVENCLNTFAYSNCYFELDQLKRMIQILIIDKNYWKQLAEDRKDP